MPSMQEALGFSAQHCITNQVWFYIPVITALGRWREEDQKCKASIDCIASSRPVWDTRGLISKTNNNKKLTLPQQKQEIYIYH